MIRQVFKKEFYEIVNSKYFVIMGLGIAVLWSLALFNGVHYYQQSNQKAKEASDASYQQWLGQGDKNPHSAAHYGFYVFKPTPLLAIIDKGSSDFLGNVVWLEAHNQNEVKNPTAADGGSLLRMGQLTLGFVLQFILPLAIILLLYSQFTRERENGTLKMLLSTRASISQLYVGKFLASLAAIGMVVLPLFLITIFVMSFQNFSENWNEEVLPALIYLLSGLSLFYTLISLFALSISLAVKKSAISLVLLCGFWLVGVFLIPRFGSVMAAWQYVTPSSFTFDQQLAEMREKGIDGHGAPNKDLLAKTLAKYGVDSISKLPVNFSAISLQASEEADAAIYDVVYQNLFEQFRQQEVWLRYSGLLSPFQTFQNFAIALSGTDTHTHLHFTNQAEKHRRMIQKAMNTYYETNAKGNESLWKSVPPFAYQPTTVSQRMALAGLDMGVLAGWLVLALVFTWFSLKQFKLD